MAELEIVFYTESRCYDFTPRAVPTVTMDASDFEEHLGLVR